MFRVNFRGILTGLNEAFAIDEAIRKELTAEDHKRAVLVKMLLRACDRRKWKRGEQG